MSEKFKSLSPIPHSFAFDKRINPDNYIKYIDPFEFS